MMSLINFKSERESNKRREELRTAREKVLKKAEAEFHQKKLEEERRWQRGDDKWMAPSVESRVRESGKSEKHKKSKKKKEKKKKEKKKKAKKKKHRSDSSSSDSDGEDDGDEDEWVEKTDEKKECVETSIRKDNVPRERDAWMIPTADISDLLERGTDNSNIRGGTREKPDSDRLNLDLMGQSSRELNPYWKDGGTGLPEDRPERTTPVARQRNVGDGGAEWLRRALRRAEEQAATEGRPLEEVAAERWGSLKHLQDMIAAAEGQRDSGRRRPAFRRPADDSSSPHPPGDRGGREQGERGGGRGGHLRGADSGRERRCSPDRRDGDRRAESGRSYGHRDYRRPESAAWKKSDTRVAEETKRDGSSTPKSADRKTQKQANSSSEGSTSESEGEKQGAAHSGAALTDLEMNELAAKLVKAEILGNEELVSQLRAKLDAARAARKAGDDKRGQEPRNEEEVVVLTRTDARGNVRPAAAPSFTADREADLWGGRRGKKANRKKTHDSKGQRVQYFADDSKFSLQDLYQREKFVSAADQQAEFVKLSAKGVEGGAAETGRPSADVEHRRAVSDSRWMAKALENCRWCLGGRQLQKHLIAALGEQVYLCVPPHRSMVEGHCFLVPSQHVSCSTQLDENVWEEMQRFRKALVAMFLGRGLDVVFFETAVHLSKMPHMVLECVPVPKESGDMAPIYFKKAIMECEMEWSMNKKLVDLDGSKNVRRAIPRGLPYFWVGFGNEDKFAHIIEDEKRFPKNFAQEIVGGMLDIDHMLWRKPKMENFDAQRQKVMQLVQWWKPYDFTRGTKRSHDSSSSSSSSSSSDCD